MNRTEQGPQTPYPSIEAYDPQAYDALFPVEERHFWFRSRNDVIAAVARQVIAGFVPGFHMIEVGCGSGNVLRALEPECRNGHLMGMDLFIEGLRYARTRTHVPLVQGDVRFAPFRKRFEIVGLFDVLEHIDDDVGVLRAIRDLMTPDGQIMLTVPAHAALWSYFDLASGHCRRYDEELLARTLTEAGFRVTFSSYFMSPLFPFVWLARRIVGLRNRRSHARPSVAPDLRLIPVVNELGYQCLRFEARLLRRRIRIPFGTSIVMVATAGNG